MLNNFSRYPLTFGPTPIQKLARLSQHLGGAVEIFAKREDCNSGLAFGGNKLRKLEYIVPDVLAHGADTLVTVGGVQSNHTRLVAAVAAKLGMRCRLLQCRWVPPDDPGYEKVGNVLLSRLMGAQTQIAPAIFDIADDSGLRKLCAEVEAEGGKPYVIPAGASRHPLGGLGYVGFADEVRLQEQALGFAFDYIVVCTVSGSTHAGMLVGFAKDGRQRRVIGIDASAKPQETRDTVLHIGRHTAEILETGARFSREDVVLQEDYAYPAYGVPSAATLEAIRLAARLEGMITDPVYEGKSMQGLVGLTARGFFPRGSRVLYVHLGGAPAVDAYSAVLSAE